MAPAFLGWFLHAVYTQTMQATLGSQIRDLRGERSQGWVAARIDELKLKDDLGRPFHLTRNALWRIEHEERFPSTVTLQALAAVLEVTFVISAAGIEVRPA